MQVAEIISESGAVDDRNAQARQVLATLNKNSNDDDLIPAPGRVSGRYGRTVNGPNGKKVKHPGVDIASPSGSKLIAPNSGTIKVVYPNHRVAGNFIELITDDGERHRFLHLSKIGVKRGDRVEKGQELGLTGGGKDDPGAGFSTGPHLHWEKYSASGEQQDPMA